MALIGELTGSYGYWDGRYAKIEFHSYNERFEGTYPNLYFLYDVQARIVAINGGYWSLQSTTSFRWGSVSSTYTINEYANYGNSQWYFVRNCKDRVGCGRSFTFNEGFGVSGYPVLNGTGSITTPTIPLPELTASVTQIDQKNCTIQWNMTSNPYNMYRIYIKKSDGTYTDEMANKGSYRFTGLNSNTSYTVYVDAYLADGSGSALVSKKLTFKTLENYPVISVTNVTYSVTSNDETDNVTFKFNSSDNSHVSKWYYQIKGMSVKSGTSTSYTEQNLSKNLESYIEVWTEDTLGRTSSKFKKEFHTTITKMTVWSKIVSNGHQLFEATRVPTKESGNCGVISHIDGSFTVYGNGDVASSVYDNAYKLTHSEIINLFSKGTVYYKVEKPTIPFFFINLIKSGEYVSTLFTSKGSAQGSFEFLQEYLDDETYTLAIGFYCNTGEKINGGTIKPMLYQNGDGVWEPFTQNTPMDKFIRGIAWCFKNGKWDLCKPYVMDKSKKWVNALPYSILRTSYFSGSISSTVMNIKAIYGNSVYEGDRTPSPDNPVNIRNFSMSDVVSYGKNLLWASQFQPSSANVTISNPAENEIKLFCGMANSSFKYAAYPLDTPLLYALKGKKIKASYKLEKSRDEINPLFQININLDNGENQYLTFTGKKEVYTFPKNAVSASFNIYLHNKPDGVIVADWCIFKDLLVYLNETYSNVWEKFKRKATSGINITLLKGDTWKNGTITRRSKKITFDGSADEDWGTLGVSQQGENIVFKYNGITVGNKNYDDGYFCNQTLPNSTTASGLTEGSYIFDGTFRFCISKSRLSTADVNGFKQWLQTHPIELEYTLRSPTTESLSIPTIPCFPPYTTIFPFSVVDGQIEWSPAQSTLMEQFYAVEQYRKVLNENT